MSEKSITYSDEFKRFVHRSIHVRETISGHPLTRELTQEEVVARKEARIKLLESQVELSVLDKGARLNRTII